MFITINGTDVSKYIATESVKHNPIWSTNAGRVLSGDFVGDIVARKWTLDLTTIPLSQADSAKITQLVESSAYFKIDFIPPNSASGKMETITVYADAPTWEVYSYVKDKVRYRSLGLNFVER